MTLGVLRRLRRVLLQHAGPALDVAELAAGQRAVLERREQPERLGVGVRHHRRVQEQDGPVRARRAVVQRDVRQPGGRDHRLDPPVKTGQHVVQPAEQVDRVVEADRPGVVPHRARRRVGLQAEPGDHPGKARAGPARRPQQVGVLPGVRADQPAVGRHHVQAHHALAGPPARPAVPALPALQQETAEADRRAVAAGERPASFGQERREFP